MAKKAINLDIDKTVEAIYDNSSDRVFVDLAMVRAVIQTFTSNAAMEVLFGGLDDNSKEAGTFNAGNALYETFNFLNTTLAEQKASVLAGAEFVDEDGKPLR